MNEDERDKLLTKIDTDVCWIKKILSNHLSHHKKLEFALLGIILGVLAKILFFS